MRARRRGRQRVDLEMRGRALDLVEQAQHVRDGEIAQARRQRPRDPARAAASAASRRSSDAVLAEEEQLVLAAEVVIEVAGRQVGGDGDVAHAGGGEAARAEDARRGAQDLDAAGVGAVSNDGSKIEPRFEL